MRLIDADAISYESIDSCDTGRHEHYYGTGIIAVRKEDIDAMPTIHSEPHWIPVTERLPEKFDYYLVSGINSVWFARYENGRFLGILSGHALDTVIAWMPLPEPYKGVTE